MLSLHFYITLYTKHSSVYAFILFYVVTSDFQGPGELPVTIPSGFTSVNVTIHIVNDKTYESDENFRLRLVSKGGARLGLRSEAVIRIVDDDCEFF